MKLKQGPASPWLVRIVCAELEIERSANRLTAASPGSR
jgi:hypothetical protein